MANYKLDFSEFDTIIEKFEELQKDRTQKQLREDGLKAAFNHYQNSLKKAYAPHNNNPHHNPNVENRTSDFIIRSDKPLSHGKYVSSIGVGFIFDNQKYPPKIGENFNPNVSGGIVAQYLMYGTRVFGTPRVEADKNLYNSLFSAAMEKEANKKVEDVVYNKITEIINK